MLEKIRRYYKEISLAMMLALFFIACAEKVLAAAPVMPTIILIEARITKGGNIEIDPTIPNNHMFSVHYETSSGQDVFVNMEERKDNPEAIEVLRLSPEQLREMWAQLYWGEAREYLGVCRPMAGQLYPDPSVETDDFIFPMECLSDGGSQ